MTSKEDHVPPGLLELYEVHEWKHTSAILANDFPREWEEITGVLDAFRLKRSLIEAAGGRKSPVASRIDRALYERGWRERRFDTKITVDESSYHSPIPARARPKWRQCRFQAVSTHPPSVAEGKSMRPSRPTLNDKLIQELTEWTPQQFIEGIQQGKLEVRKIVCRLLRESQRTKQSQMPTDTKRRPARMPKGKKETPALSPRRNTSGIVGVCPPIDNGVQLGWVAYYQKDGIQRVRNLVSSDSDRHAVLEAARHPPCWRADVLARSRGYLKGTIIAHALAIIWGWFSDSRDPMRINGLEYERGGMRLIRP